MKNKFCYNQHSNFIYFNEENSIKSYSAEEVKSLLNTAEWPFPAITVILATNYYCARSFSSKLIALLFDFTF